MHLALAAGPERTRVPRMHYWLDKDGGSGCGSYTGASRKIGKA